MGFKDKVVGIFAEEEDDVVQETEKKPKEIKEKEEDGEEEIEIDLKKTFSAIGEFSKNKYIYFLLLVPILLLSLWIRLRNLAITEGKYLLGLDPYYFYRLTEYILENASEKKFEEN